MENDQESERPVNIINHTDVDKFLASNPSPEELEELDKHELGLLASYYQLSLPLGSNKRSLLNALKEEIYGILNPDVGGDRGRDERNRSPSPTSSVHPEVIPPALSSSEYLRLKELELEQDKIRLEREKLQAGGLTGSPHQQSSFCKNFSDRIKVIPSFNENDVLGFFNAFEKTAMGLEWPRKEWSVIAQTSFTGKARKVYDNLTFSQCADYDYMKSEILKIYTLTPEAYRQTFRKVHKKPEESYMDFATRLEHSFLMWLRSCDVMNGDEEVDGAKLYQLVLVEQFLSKVPKETDFYLRDKNIDLSQVKFAATQADHYWVNMRAAYGAGDLDPARGLTNRPTNTNHPFQPHKNSQYSGRSNFPKKPVHHPNKVPGMGASQPPRKPQPPPARFNSPYYCNYCRKSGHTENRCFAKHGSGGVTKSHAFSFAGSRMRLPAPQMTCVADPQDTRPIAQVVKSTPAADQTKPGSDVVLSYTSTPIESCSPFVFPGYVTLSGQKYPVTILRDTGATGSLLINPTGKPFESCESILIRGVAGFDTFPKVNVHLDCELVKATADVGVVESLPIPGIDLLLGNDIAGAKVFPHPIVSSEPVCVPETVSLEQQHPEVFNVCAVTRSMAKVMNTPPESVAESGMGENSDKGSMEVDGAVISQLDVPAAVEEGALAQMFEPPLPTPFNDIGLSKFRELQLSDPQLTPLRNIAVDEDVCQNESGVVFYVKNGLLWRRYRPLHVNVDDGVWDSHQLVVPQHCRRQLLEMAHAGHLGVRKTLQRLRKHFYWKHMKTDVSRFVKECHPCQVAGKPNQPVPVSPLKPIPVMQNPFERIIVDIVGPLPKTSSGYSYLLTILDVATRYPEAIPLRTIHAKVVVRELLHFFTRFGLPLEVQSDQGTNFMSKLFGESLAELGIAHVVSSAYHPQSQGALERYHQTLKSMLRKYCEETGQDWDKGVPFLLFATREVPSESLGFSPHELIFGHHVRGPLMLVKERWNGTVGPPPSVLQYVTDFKERLVQGLQMAHTNLTQAQGHMKEWYDRKARERTFQENDEVLVLLPFQGQPLSAKFSGPYRVCKRVGETDYLVETPDRRKRHQLCHVNMLKPYHRSHSLPSVACSLIQDEGDFESDELSFPPCFQSVRQWSEENSDAFAQLNEKLSHVTSPQSTELVSLLQKYPSVFGDSPGQTNLTYHDIDVGCSTPVKLPPYRVHPSRYQAMQDEIKYMLDRGLITPCISEWSSPVTLVPKPDGTFRFCVDYRKVNSLTKSDSYPLPRVDACIDALGCAKFVTKLDLVRGYWQIPLTERAKDISTFVTPQGTYRFEVMPYGLKNAPATFQRLMNQLVADIDNCAVYIDDLIVFSDTWEDHLVHLEKVLVRLSEASLVLNLKKCEFVKAHVQYLGYIVGQGKVCPPLSKVEAIAKVPRPENRRGLQRFLGMIGYYRRFVTNFSDVTAPLTELLKKGKMFQWTPECEHAFQSIKDLLTNRPILHSPDFKRPFKLATDASNLGAGAVLLQSDHNDVDHPISYFSRKFNSAQQNYSVVEKELLAIILALQFFSAYLPPSGPVITIYTDHHPLKFLDKFKNKNQRLTRWSLLLQEYNLDVQHVKGVHNVLADGLSRV